MRKYSIYLVIMFLITSAIAGCTPKVNENDPNANKQISIATSGVSGTFYPIGGAMAQILTDNLPGVSAIAEATGGGVENLRLVESKEVFAGIISDTTLAGAFEGREPFEKGEFTKVRTAFQMFPGYMYFVTTDPNIKSISQIKGKRVTVGDAGSASVTDAQDSLNAMGITFDDIRPVYLGKSNAMNALRDGLADVAIEGAGGRPAFISDFMATRKLYFIPISEEEIQAVTSQLPYHPGAIPASWFNTEEDVPTLIPYVTMIVNEDAAEDDVYNFVKTIFEHLEEVKKSHPAAGEMSLDNAYLDAGAPFHPGAVKYFEEAGLTGK